MADVGEMLQQSLKRGEYDTVLSVLSDHFPEAVESPDFVWLQELKNLGHSLVDITQILVDDARGSPWIFLDKEPKEIPQAFATADFNAMASFHKTPCFHEVTMLDREPRDGKDDLEQDALPAAIRHTVALHCGLAGVLPKSRNEQLWIGTVSFADAGTCASISYTGEFGWLNLRQRIAKVLTRFFWSTKCLQRRHLCCNGLTLISGVPGDHPSVMMKFVPYKYASDLYEALCENDSPFPGATYYIRLAERATRILSKVYNTYGTLKLWEKNILVAKDSLHLAALATQVLTFGLLSYSQSHTGRLNLPYLMEPIREVELQGIGEGDPGVSVRLERFSCLNGMVGDKVFVFSTHQSFDIVEVSSEGRRVNLAEAPPYEPTEDSMPEAGKDQRRKKTIVSKPHSSPVPSNFTSTLQSIPAMRREASHLLESEAESSDDRLHSRTRYDLIATPEDFLATWDDGALIIDNKADPQCNVIGIQISGGTIIPYGAPTLKSQYGAQTKPNPRKMYHWARRSPNYALIRDRFSRTTAIHIGAANVNTGCPVNNPSASNVALCWQAAYRCGYIRPLGPQSEYWDSGQWQLGLQAGPQYALVQGSRTMTKRPEKSLKVTNLERNPVPISFLEAHWGVQISVCTGVARRVSLCELLADMVFPFLAAGIAGDYHWLPLLATHGFLEALRGNALRAWTQNPQNADVIFHASQIIHKILSALKDTGIDRKGEKLVVAWAHMNDPYSCVEFRCSKANVWVRILADSTDCATFAYMTHLCLESDTKRCRALAQPPWRHETAMLDTAVCRQTPTPNPDFVLDPSQPYWIGRHDLYLLARVERTLPGAVCRLYISEGGMPEKIQRRVAKFSIVNAGRSSRIIHLRERSLVGIPAEQVFVLAAE